MKSQSCMFLQGMDISTDPLLIYLFFQYYRICKTLLAIRIFQVFYTLASVKLERIKNGPEMQGQKKKKVVNTSGKQLADRTEIKRAAEKLIYNSRKPLQWESEHSILILAKCSDLKYTVMMYHWFFILKINLLMRRWSFYVWEKTINRDCTDKNINVEIKKHCKWSMQSDLQTL